MCAIVGSIQLGKVDMEQNEVFKIELKICINIAQLGQFSPHTCKIALGYKKSYLVDHSVKTKQLFKI